MRTDVDQYYTPMKEKWDKEWEEIWPIYYWRLRQHYRTVEQYLLGTVLDIGCGPGYLAGSVKPNESLYTGLDISSFAAIKGKMLFPGATFMVHDAEHEPLPFQDNHFKTVVASEIVEHVMDPSLLLREARRVAISYMVFTVPVSMGGVGHVHPEWAWEDIQRTFSPLGRFLEIRCNVEYNFWLIWMAK